MNDLKRIVKVSNTLAWLCRLMLIALPFYLAHHWLLPASEWIDTMPIGGRDLDTANWPPSAGKQILGLLITFVPGGFIALVLYRLRQLLLNYAAGQFFTAENVGLYSRVAGAAMGFVITLFLAESALIVVLSYGTPNPYISLSFTHTHAVALFAALVFRLVTGIMAVGHRLELENQGFV